MEYFEFLSPVHEDIINSAKSADKKNFANILNIYRDKNAPPELSSSGIAIIGVEEDRNAYNNEGCANGVDYIRSALYHLFPAWELKGVTDLGNIKKGHNVNDTYFALKTILTDLLKQNIIPLIIGGSQDLTYINYQAYESLNQIINLVAVDSYFDLGENEDQLDSHSYLSRIILHQPNFLFNYTNLAFQSYLNDREAVHLMRKLYFDTIRLGELRSDIREVEPYVRNADLLSFDISAIRQSDAPANNNVTPNGLYSEEACQITRYAGLSDKLTSIGFFEYNPLLDNNGQTAKLIAQLIWHFFDGYVNRKADFPYKEKEDFLKYMVRIENQEEEIKFYKSKKSDRWWMEVYCPSGKIHKYSRHYLVPCSYSDYQDACNNEVPDRYWKAFQKFN